jgi:hypothetical protein
MILLFPMGSTSRNRQRPRNSFDIVVILRLVLKLIVVVVVITTIIVSDRYNNTMINIPLFRFRHIILGVDGNCLAFSYHVKRNRNCFVPWNTRIRTKRHEHSYKRTGSIQPMSSMSLSCNDENHTDTDDESMYSQRNDLNIDILQTMESVQEKIIDLNHGRWINCNSPRQVSAAIFGNITLTSTNTSSTGTSNSDDDLNTTIKPSTNQRFLQKVVRGEFLDMPFRVDERQQQLAALILQYRSLLRQQQQQSSSSSSTSSSATSTKFPSHPLMSITSAAELDVKDNDLSNPTTLSVEDDTTDSSCNVKTIIRAQSPQTDADTISLEKAHTNPSSTMSHVKLHDTTNMNTYQKLVEQIFTNPKGKIHHYWKESLLHLSRPTAQMLVSQLDSEQCPMGYDPLAVPLDPFLRRFTVDTGTSNSGMSTSTASTTQAGKKGSFLSFCREQKEKYPDCIILTRCGDFYETFGLDAIMLVEYCGLNPMANKAKAGCPIRNVQATIDGLIEQGFRVAVYEEGIDTDASNGYGASGGSKSRIKSRFLAQIVSSASPTYMYDLVLLDNSSDSMSTGPISRPYIGIISSQSGYTLTEVSIEERTVRVSERLTTEAVACRLAACPPADPLFYVPSINEYEAGGSHPTTSISIPFLPSRRDIQLSGPGGRIRTKILPPFLVLQHSESGSDVERAKNIIVSALLELTEFRNDDEEEGDTEFSKKTTTDDYTLITDETSPHGTQTNSLYLETAKQLGLMNDGAIPSLVPYLVPESAPAATKRFLRRLLLTPPPPNVSTSLSTLVSLLMSDNGPAIPPMTVPPLGKILALIRAGQAGAHVYGEVLQTLHATILILDLFSSLSNDAYTVDENKPLITTSDAMTSLMTILEYESGMAASPASLKRRCSEAIGAIEKVLCPIYHLSEPNVQTDVDERISDCSTLIPQSFLERNEAIWRGRVRKDAAPDAYYRVQVAAERLSQAFEEDFNDGCKNLIVQDIFNNIIALKDKPTTSKIDVNYIHPRDRFGKVIGNRYTTEAVQAALSDYVNACDKAAADVTKALVTLSHTLHDCGHLPAIVQASHTNLILSTAFFHAVKATSLGWSLAKTFEPDPEYDNAGHFHGVWPYWMERSEAVKNTFDLSGMWVLTAPNMSGKSTIMRSTAAAALLSVCGLCAPLQKRSEVRRFDHIFVRGASSDIPSEQKSAFGAEMADVAALLRCCTAKSLVFVDELGRGTSPRDGTRLSGAVLEAMAGSGMSGIFATHLHDILKLPLQSMNRITNKRMAIHERNVTNGEYSWTYRLEDGVCTDSLALITAKQFGLPNEILQRAEDLSTHLPETSFETIVPTVRDSHHDNLIMHNISLVVEKTTGQRVIEVAPGWNAPAAYDGKSVVYVLQLNTKPTRYYVGESDNIRKRIEKHRGKSDRYNNAIVYIAIAPLGKSQARMWEYRIIRKMASSGFLLDSVADGRTIRSMHT